MTTAKTDRVKVKFIVKEFGEGTPWIAIEPPDGKQLPAVGDGFQGLDLAAGTTYEQAQEIAQYLNEQITSISHTFFIKEIEQDKPF